MDISNVKVAQTAAYNASETYGSRAVSEETADAVQETEAASFEADGGRTYSASATRATYTPDTETIERLKSENEQRMANLVKQMLGQQIEESQMWEKLRTGDFTADEETVEQAQQDIADDGYWGVEQTSDRFVQYATALTGGDPDKLDSMIEAFEKGYAEAEKAWGGELPELSQRTREATLKKFQALKEQYANGSGPVAEAAEKVADAKAKALENDA